MSKTKRARSGPITSQELSTAIEQLRWLAAHGQSEHVRTRLLGTIAACYLVEQEREKERSATGATPSRYFRGSARAANPN